MSNGKTWIVTTEGSRPIQQIAKDLKKAGLTVEQINDAIQSIVGKGSDEAASKARSVAGVIDVSPDTSVDIGPPDSSETW